MSLYNCFITTSLFESCYYTFWNSILYIMKFMYTYAAKIEPNLIVSYKSVMNGLMHFDIVK